jgi:hypothetical protein
MFFFTIIRLVDGGRRKVESEPGNRIKICRRRKAAHFHTFWHTYYQHPVHTKLPVRLVVSEPLTPVINWRVSASCKPKWEFSDRKQTVGRISTPYVPQNAGNTVTIGSLLRHAFWPELKALGFFETSVNIYMSTLGNILEDVNLWIHKCCTHNEEEVFIQCQ